MNNPTRQPAAITRILIALVATFAVAAPAATMTASPAAATTGQQWQAIGAAHDYLRIMPFSKRGLIHQLSSPYGEDFPYRVAVYAVNHIRVSWYHQAVRSARGYLRVMHFSCNGLIHQLESEYGEQFTHRQAVYGARHTSAC